jgi:hypothetical protein
VVSNTNVESLVSSLTMVQDASGNDDDANAATDTSAASATSTGTTVISAPVPVSSASSTSSSGLSASIAAEIAEFDDDANEYAHESFAISKEQRFVIGVSCSVVVMRHRVCSTVSSREWRQAHPAQNHVTTVVCFICHRLLTCVFRSSRLGSTTISR